MEFRGARYLHVFVPCPLGWGSASKRHDPDRPARQGDGPLPGLRGRARRGRQRLEDPPAGAGRGVPAAAAPLRAPVRRPAAHRRDRADPGAAPTATSAASACSSRRRQAVNGEAVRDHARRRLQPRQQDRHAGAPSAPVYVDRLPPCNHACPAGENIQHWLYEAEEGGDGYERAWRQIMEDNPFPAVMGRVCYHPCETACNRGAARRGGRHQLGRALPRRRGDRAAAGASRSTPRRSGKRVLVVGAGPSGLSAAYHLARLGHSVTVHDAGPAGRRDDALRHPAVPAAARRARRRGRSGSSTSASTLELNTQGHEHPRRDAGGRLRRRLPRRRRPHRQARLHPRRLGRARSSTPSRCCAAWRARSSRCSAGASSSTAAATPRWTRRAPRSGSAPRRRSSSTGAPATGCRPTTSRSRRPRRRAC